MLSMWDLIMCIHRNKRLIVIITVLALVAGYAYTSLNQSYTAQIIVKYTGVNAENGRNEDGTPLAPFEMSNPQVLERALSKLGMSTAGIENVRKSMKITPIIPTREEEKDESIVQNAFSFEEDKKYYPVYYKVSLDATASQGVTYARNLLDAVMEQYMQFYSEKYLNNASVSDIGTDLSVDDYDYIKMCDIILNEIDVLNDYMEQLAKDNSSYRSSSTGLTFSDISSELAYIRNVEIPVIYGSIVDNNISKDLDDTIKNYTYQSETLEIEANSNHKKALETNELMKLYAKKNDVSLWDDPFSNGETQEDQVTDVYTYGHYSQQKTTYDDLVDDYVEYETNYKRMLLESKEAKAVADRFSANTHVASDEEVQKVQISLELVRSKVVSLINSATETVSDFNQFKSAENISYISGILVKENLPKALNLLIFVIVGFGLSIVAIIAWNMYQNIRVECIRKAELMLKVEDGYGQGPEPKDDGQIPPGYDGE